MSRYDATIKTVKHYHRPPGERQDVEIVTARLDFADGAMWWLEDEGKVKVGDRYTIHVAKRGEYVE
jgi:hypothetical protein